MGEQPSASMQATWLVVQSADRAGLLAETAQIITAHGHNIKSYNGAAGTNGGFAMKYSLEGDVLQQAEMVAAIELMPGVQSVTFGCGTDQAESASSDDDGWS